MGYSSSTNDQMSSGGVDISQHFGGINNAAEISTPQYLIIAAALIFSVYLITKKG